MTLRQTLVASFAVCALLGAAPVLAQQPAKPAAAADMPKAKVKAGYKVPRLEGVWTNATATRLERTANYGDRLTMTKQEAAEIENATFARNARINAPTAQATVDNWKDLAKGPDTLDECRGGSRGVACGRG